MAATTFDSLERLAGAFGSTKPSKRMLVIVNPYATTVSDRLKHLVVYALQGRYQVDSVETRGAQPRDRAVPRGGAGRLRRRLRLRRRRDRQRGRQRARRLRHAADLPAGRLDQRLRADPRDPQRRRRRDRAPAAAGRRIRAARDRPRRRRRPPLPLHRRHRPRRHRHPARRRAPAAEGPLRPLVLQPSPPISRLQPRLRRQARRGWSPRSTGTQIEGVTAMVQNATPSPTSAGGRSSWPRASRSTTARSPASCSERGQPARHADRHLPRARRAAPGSSSTAASPPSPAPREVTIRSRDDRELPLQVDGDYLGVVPEARFWVDHHGPARHRLRRCERLSPDRRFLFPLPPRRSTPALWVRDAGAGGRRRSSPLTIAGCPVSSAPDRPGTSGSTEPRSRRD